MGSLKGALTFTTQGGTHLTTVVALAFTTGCTHLATVVALAFTSQGGTPPNHWGHPPYHVVALSLPLGILTFTSGVTHLYHWRHSPYH